MKKYLSKVLIALFVGAVLLGAVAWYQNSKLQAGSKSIEITMIIDNEDGPETIYEKTIRTDAEKLGDLLDEMVEDKKIEMETSGSKTDPYGRMIVSIEGYATTDFNAGPWWLISSSNNKDCVAAGFCSGIDLAPIYDKDEFTFLFSSSFE